MSDDIPKYIIVENYIKKEIKNKTLIDKLPGERSLAKDLGFSYMTIRKAIEIWLLMAFYTKCLQKVLM